MKQLKELFETHLFLTWIISSGLFALIIHFLFSISAPNEWLAAKWKAGDILTFVSTVALGLLAVWQNKKFKRENDAAQNRLENLTKRANELSVISKIIERESENVLGLRTKIQNFISMCSVEETLVDLSGIANQPDNFKKLFLKINMNNRDKQIRLCAIELLSELKTYPDNEEVSQMISLITKYCQCSTKLVQEVCAGVSFNETYEEKTSIEKEFLMVSSNFISNREILLNKVIFENLTLEQIKKIYSGRFSGRDN